MLILLGVISGLLLCLGFLYYQKRKADAAKLIRAFADTLVFSVRGTLTARYSTGGPTGMAFGNTAPVSAADVGALSGNSIQWAASNNAKGVCWQGRSNTPNGRAISVLYRVRPGYTGSPTTQQGSFSIVCGSGKWASIEIAHTTAGNLIVNVKNELAASVFNSVSFGAWAPVSGTWYDIVFVWDGTTTANAATLYVDAVALSSQTAAAAFTASWNNQYFTEINLGTGNLGSTINAGRVDEFVIWGNVIDPTAVILDSGSGSLNGALRTSLVATAAFDGSTYTDPGIGNVKNGIPYIFAGSGLTGTLATSTSSGGIAFGGPSPMGRN